MSISTLPESDSHPAHQLLQPARLPHHRPKVSQQRIRCVLIPSHSFVSTHPTPALVDRKLMVALLQSQLKAARSEPLRSILSTPVGLNWNATDAEALAYIKQNLLVRPPSVVRSPFSQVYKNEYHPIGTASLGSEGVGGTRLMQCSFREVISPYIQVS
jgi:hypothetical protein